VNYTAGRKSCKVSNRPGLGAARVTRKVMRVIHEGCPRQAAPHFAPAFLSDVQILPADPADVGCHSPPRASVQHCASAWHCVQRFLSIHHKAPPSTTDITKNMLLIEFAADQVTWTMYVEDRWLCLSCVYSHNDPNALPF
jgi:hypothetical protein